MSVALMGGGVAIETRMSGTFTKCVATDAGQVEGSGGLDVVVDLRHHGDEAVQGCGAQVS